VSCLYTRTTTTTTTTRTPLYVHAHTHTSPPLPLSDIPLLLYHYILLTNGHCATEPLQQKGDGRFAYNYKRWRWRRRSTSLRLVLTTGPQPDVIISGDRRRCCCVRHDDGAEAKKLSLVTILVWYSLCFGKIKKTRTYTHCSLRTLAAAAAAAAVVV